MNNSLTSVEGSDVGGADERTWSDTMYDNTTFSVAEYLQTHLGARYRSLAETVALSIVYVIILITGVVGITGNHRCCR